MNKALETLNQLKADFDTAVMEKVYVGLSGLAVEIYTKMEVLDIAGENDDPEFKAVFDKLALDVMVIGFNIDPDLLPNAPHPKDPKEGLNECAHCGGFFTEQLNDQEWCPLCVHDPGNSRARERQTTRRQT